MAFRRSVLRSTRHLCRKFFSSQSALPTLYPKKLNDVIDVNKLMKEHPIYDGDKLNNTSVETIQQMYSIAIVLFNINNYVCS